MKYHFYFECYSLKRSENVSRSPLFDHISASVEGIQTIHSLGQTDGFIETLKEKLDVNRYVIWLVTETFNVRNEAILRNSLSKSTVMVVL